jgi:hypothetical protein
MRRAGLLGGIPQAVSEQLRVPSSFLVLLYHVHLWWRAP